MDEWTENDEIKDLQNAESAERSKKLRSLIWDHFSVDPNDPSRMICKYCPNVSIPRKNSCTTGGWSHLENSHKAIYDAVKLRKKEAQLQPKPKLDKNSKRAQMLRRAIAMMMILDLEPYSLVERNGFKYLMFIAEPLFEVPSRTTYSTSIIPKMYKEETECLKLELKMEFSRGKTIYW